MARFKALLVTHGEKLALLLVAVLALWSVGANLMSEAGSGVSPGEIRTMMDQVEDYLRREKPRTEAEPVRKVHKKVESVRNVAKSADPFMLSGWETVAFYVQPPKPLNPPEVRVPTAGTAPPERYRPRLDPAREINVYVGGRRNVIVWRADKRWVKDVRAVIWRKAVGMGSEEAQAARISARETEGKGRERRPAGRRAGGPAYGPDPMAGPGGGYQEQLSALTAGSRAGPAMPSGTPAPEEEGLDPALIMSEAEREARRLERLEEMAAENLERIGNRPTFTKSRWRLLKAGVEPISFEPPVEQLLTRGTLATEEETQGGNAARPETQPAGANGEEQDLWFYFVDETELDQNMVYRYRIALYAKPKLLPEELAEKKEYKGWPVFIRVGETRRGLLKGELFEQIKEMDSSASLAAGAKQLHLPSLAPVEGKIASENPEEEKPREGTYYTLPPQALADTELRKKLATEEAYAPYAWSEYILTPVRTRLFFTGLFGEDTANIRVELVDAFGERQSEQFRVKKPEFTPPADPGKTVYEHYVKKIGFPTRVKPAPIGEEREINGVKTPFTTVWGLVDIRTCKRVSQRFRMVQKTDARGIPMTDAEGNPILRKEPIGKPLELKWDYLVLMELNPRDGNKPRFIPLPRHRAYDPTREDVKYVYPRSLR